MCGSKEKENEKNTDKAIRGGGIQQNCRWRWGEGEV